MELIIGQSGKVPKPYKILLVFTYKLHQQDDFNRIIAGFQKNNYVILYFDVEKESFRYEKLKKVVEQLNTDYQGAINKISVISNVRDLIMLWYRIYNSLADDFIYFIDENDAINLKCLENNNLLQQLSSMANIGADEVAGRIYVNVNLGNYLRIADLVFRGSNYKLFSRFSRLDNINFDTGSVKSRKLNQYLFHDSEYCFLDPKGIACEDINTINLDLPSPASTSEKDMVELINYDVEFFIYFILTCLEKESFEICRGILIYLINLVSVIKIDNMKDLLYEVIDRNEIGFIRKGQVMALITIIEGGVPGLKGYKAYYELLNQWLKAVYEKKDLSDYLCKNSIQSIAIYGLGELGKRLYDALVGTNINVVCFIDKNAAKIGTYQCKPVVWLDRKALLSGLDAIVVTPYCDFHKIKTTLEGTISNIKIISLKNIIFEI